MASQTMNEFSHFVGLPVHAAINQCLVLYHHCYLCVPVSKHAAIIDVC